MTETDLEKAIAALPFDIPDGDLLRSWRDRKFRFYLSDEPAPPHLWPMLRGRHSQSGLWPVFFEGSEDLPAYLLLNGHKGRIPEEDAPPAEAEAVLARQWVELTAPSELDIPETAARWAAYFSPFGPTWPGLASAGTEASTPGRAADDLARRLNNGHDTLLGLVMVERPADIPAMIGWRGGESIQPEEVSAVLRSWEDRFGTRLVRIGFESLVLSVAAPPRSRAGALAVAAEQVAFCGSILTTGFSTLAQHAEELIGAGEWFLEWDPL
jgi:hypothetical protein